ncbi:MAG: NADH-ubiquinone oxidoreductase-F iron-sulfur binding region domain-containing protein [Candidatus Kapaibacterium sp.]
MKNSIEKIREIKDKFDSDFSLLKKRIIICAGTGCIANGAMKVHRAFRDKLDEKGLKNLTDLRLKKEEDENILISGSGCQGFCQMGPLVSIEPDGILYVIVKESDVEEIINKTIIEGKPVERLLFKDPATGKSCKGQADINFYKKQSRFVLKECGHLDPEVIEEYISHGGYQPAYEIYTGMDSKEICEKMIDSGLRGRGGGGFPTGLKWELARKEVNKDKYVICNGDEGDPGAFMDRSLMEGNPHAVIEGMMIAAKAIGANKGYIYVRAEYPLAVKRIRKAVEKAREFGYLGKNIFGTEYDFDIEVMEGAGAFVCGEETALMASIEGERGMPRPKPPFPSESGLFGKPTIINNVETLATVPLIFKIGIDKYKEFGTEKSKGTKTFALTGHVVNTGLIEVPFGSTLREIVFNIGGGVTKADGTISNEDIKAVQIGGPSGGCLTKDQLDYPLDFDSLKSIGSMIGSGGLVVMNNDTCIVRIARYFMEFTQDESCGKCVLCREGTKQILALLDDIIEGRGTMGTIDLLERLSKAVQKGSLCGLGKSAPNPILSTINNFRDEYLAHVVDKKCPTKECKALCDPEIIEEKCKGCGLCIKACPVGAITGERKQIHIIDVTKCIKCGACADACKLNAVIGV